MKASIFLEQIHRQGINTIAGVPDSTLKQLCDAICLNTKGQFQHYVAANEGAAVGIAVGTYLATGKPACIYMQNSGQGNIINPLASIANEEVYGIPMLFLIGWRGEPGIKDEPQHVYQGKVTCKLLEDMGVPYAIIDEETTSEETEKMLQEARGYFARCKQYAIIIKKRTFESETEYHWENGYTLVREQALRVILEKLYEKAYFVSTTGKISRELYEQSNALYGRHDKLFMTVGGMGHASMIAFGIAQACKAQECATQECATHSCATQKKIVCVDGDGAVLMHMGAIAFIADNAPKNLLHIVINNAAHESVGAIPTGYSGHDYAQIAKACGYPSVFSVDTEEGLREALQKAESADELSLIEVKVALDSRKDLGRPKETASENKEAFMKAYGSAL